MPASTARKSNAGRKENARLNLIVAAERLMVEQGMDSVSLRQIGTAAGQKNAAALQYHFGSRLDLVWAIMELRTTPVNERRQAMLAYIQAAGQAVTIADLARALVLPLTSSLLEHGREKTYYARFMARVLSDPEIIEQVTQHPAYQSIRDCARLYRGICPDLSRDLINLRIRMASSAMIMEAAELERMLSDPAGRPDDDELDQRINMIIGTIAGLLAA